MSKRKDIVDLKKWSVKSLVQNIRSCGQCFQVDKMPLEQLQKEERLTIRELNRRIREDEQK